jgi:oligoendopeptidase F
MSVVYPGLESPEFASGFAHVTQEIGELAQLFDTYHIEKQPALAVDASTIAAFETLMKHYNQVLEEYRTLDTYISCFVTTNTMDTVAQAKMSELQQYSVILAQLDVRFSAWIGSLDVEELIARSEIAREYAFKLRKTKIRAQHLMSPAEENLASELNLSGGTGCILMSPRNSR